MKPENDHLMLTDKELQSVISNDKRLVIILFVAVGNAISYLMKSNFQDLPAKLKRRISWFMMSQESDRYFVETYNIQQIPSLLFFQNRQLIDILPGLVSKTELKKKIMQWIN